MVLQNKMSEILAEGLLEKGNAGKDLISLLSGQSNTDKSLPVEQRLSDKEVVDQITTFMAAGNDTTSIAVTWSLRQLVKTPEIQTRLRNELFTITEDRPDLDTRLAALPGCIQPRGPPTQPSRT
ncbi:hypothetical protein IAR50_002327 [Cryptococcus sp. DSM 104548]